MGWLYPLVGFIAFLYPVFRPPAPMKLDDKYLVPYDSEDYNGTGALDSFAAGNDKGGEAAVAPANTDTNKVLDEKEAAKKAAEIELGVQEGAVKA